MMANVPLTGLTVADSAYDVSSCALPGMLAVDASFDCVIGPFMAEAGQHNECCDRNGDDWRRRGDCDRQRCRQLFWVGIVQRSVFGNSSR